MTSLLKHEPKKVERVDLFDRFDRMFDDWPSMLPFRRPMMATWDWMPDDLIKVDEYREDGAFVVRAELPGIDPDKDVELTVTDGLLTINAERREETTSDTKGVVRREMRYGTFTRTLALPTGITEADIVATYVNGILEIRVPMPAPEPVTATKIPITKN